MKILQIIALIFCFILFHMPNRSYAMSQSERIETYKLVYGYASCTILSGICDLREAQIIAQDLEKAHIINEYERSREIRRRDYLIDDGITKILSGSMIGLFTTIYALLSTFKNE